MAIELAEIAAGLPVAASLAMASGLTALREGRRRTSLNEAVHELRRPLQALALSLPPDQATAEAAESSLRMAAAAVERLDREINGGAAAPPLSPVPLKPLIEAAVARWQPRAAAEGRPLSSSWRASEIALEVDEAELEQTVDNLLSNAFEHGRERIAVEVCERGGLLRLVVRDRGDRERQPRPSRRRCVRDRVAGRSRHGHGLRIVRRLAARHGGSFRLRRCADGGEARLDLPLPRGGR